MGIKKVDAAQIKAGLDAGRKMTIIESLPIEYFRKGHLPGAICMDHEDSEDEISLRLRDKAAEIIVYCASVTCKNSEILSERLVSLGYRNISVFPEGKEGWLSAGYPFERKDSKT